jgi:RNA polymerase sigma-B factor
MATAIAPQKETLIHRFLPLAQRLARRYYGGGEPLEDLYQVACMGLVKAVDRYDDSRGVSFSSYAVPTITGELKRHFRDNAWAVHVPRGLRERALEVHKQSRDITEGTGRTPRTSELATRLGIDEAQVNEALRAYTAFDAVSLDAPVGHGDDSEPQLRLDTVGRLDDGYELTDDRLTIAEAVRRLPAQERLVLQMRFGEERTQSDIAERIGVSQMQVSRILRRTLDRLEATVKRSLAAAA